MFVGHLLLNGQLRFAALDVQVGALDVSVTKEIIMSIVESWLP